MGTPAPLVQDSAQAFVLSPRQKRDPSPAELGLVTHQAGTSMVPHYEDLTHIAGTCIRVFHAYTVLKCPAIQGGMVV